MRCFEEGINSINNERENNRTKEQVATLLSSFVCSFGLLFPKRINLLLNSSSIFWTILTLSHISTEAARVIAIFFYISPHKLRHWHRNLKFPFKCLGDYWNFFQVWTHLLFTSYLHIWSFGYNCSHSVRSCIFLKKLFIFNHLSPVKDYVKFIVVYVVTPSNSNLVRRSVKYLWYNLSSNF